MQLADPGQDNGDKQPTAVRPTAMYCSGIKLSDNYEQLAEIDNILTIPFMLVRMSV